MTMADLFQRIEDRKDEWNVEVMVTFLEIYNEEIRDLLAEPGSHAARGGLSIREDKTVKVVGLVELKPRTAEEVKEIVLQGNLRRTQSPTHANETSSRSHAVLQIHVTQSPRTAALTEQKTMATLSIIDLAGSERAAATSNMGQRMVEGANINKSLLALGNCINALCESGGAVRHVPYRNSKLTRLLKFSLGGNCKTVMIVCIAPTSSHFDDTHNTLVYAERATKIRTKVVTRNVVNVDRHVGRYVEAINRLNVEVAELKEKLAGRRASESDVVARKKAEAKAELERAKNDIQLKAEQTKAAIVEGATCSGKLSIAKVKLGAIQARLFQIETASPTAASQAERGLLQALAHPEEEAIKPGSLLNTRLQRSSNANAMFDATMRAVSERKSEKLDDVSVDNMKLEASFRKASMEKLKAESERDALRDTMADMADVMVKLVGMLGRCTVMVGEAANVLSKPFDKDDMGMTAKRVATTLENIREKNDETFKGLVGHSTESYTVQDSVESTALESFHQYGATFTRRTSSGPAVLQQIARSNTSRRSSTYGNISVSASPPRRSHKSPRKSLRSSLASQPYRRAPEKEKKVVKSAKNVQWRDEAGQGDLDDGGSKVIPAVSLAVIPPSPLPQDSSSEPPLRAPSPVLRCSSSLGSESEWEDDNENEKTDDSFNMSFMASSSSSSLHLSSSSSSRPTAGRRPRPSRLDPGFLKSKSKLSILGSLVEDDENVNDSRCYPLSEMNINRMGSTSDSGSSDGNLHVPKVRDRLLGSPNRRAPSTGKASGVLASTSKGRRRSNIGPMRNEKGRRRSSMIPQLSPPAVEGGTNTGARRVLLGSPKRSKRSSLTRSLNAASLKAKSTSMANLSISIDPNMSGDLSTNKHYKPTWR
jgi:kinesin family protein 18/19